MKTFEIRVWEKAEHWYFDAMIEAKDEASAWKRALKEYPTRNYHIADLREKN